MNEQSTVNLRIVLPHDSAMLQKRFGLVYIDYSTQQRIVKDSGLAYKDLITSRNSQVSISQIVENR